VALLNDLYMAKQARRRKFLLAETAKSGTGGSNVLAQSVSSKLKSVVSGGFGFSSRCVNDEVLRENPFLDNSVKLCVSLLVNTANLSDSGLRALAK